MDKVSTTRLLAQDITERSTVSCIWAISRDEHTGIDGKVHGIYSQDRQHYHGCSCLFLVWYQNSDNLLGEPQCKEAEGNDDGAYDDEGPPPTPFRLALVGNDADDRLDDQSG